MGQSLHVYYNDIANAYHHLNGDEPILRFTESSIEAGVDFDYTLDTLQIIATLNVEPFTNQYSLSNLLIFWGIDPA